MKKEPLMYIEDMLEAIRKIQHYTNELEYEEFNEDQKTQDAVIRQFMILGEAAKYFGKTQHRKVSSIPWRDIIGMRNILVHNYDYVAGEKIWKTINTDLEPLSQALSVYLNQEQK